MYADAMQGKILRRVIEFCNKDPHKFIFLALLFLNVNKISLYPNFVRYAIIIVTITI